MTSKNSDYQNFWDKLCDWITDELDKVDDSYSEKDRRTNSDPITQQPVSRIPHSLSNIKANCYLNAALQGISSCNKFFTDISTEYKNNSGLKKLKIFYKLLFILNGGEGNRLEISRCPIFREWNKPGQQDSFELLAYVMNQVYNEIRTDKENTGEIPKRNMEEWLKIQLPMRILIKYTIKCGCGNKVKVPLQSDLALHVSIPSTENELQILINQYFLEDKVQNFHCDKKGCNGENAIRYTRLCKPLPRTLCIHLQRTFWNGKKMIKIKTIINFTRTLKIENQFCTLKNIRIKKDSSKTSKNIYPTDVKGSTTAIENVNNNVEKVILTDEAVSNSNGKHCDNFFDTEKTEKNLTLVTDSITANKTDYQLSNEFTVDDEMLPNSKIEHSDNVSNPEKSINLTEVKDSMNTKDTDDHQSNDSTNNNETFSNSNSENFDKNTDKDVEKSPDEIYILTSVIVHSGSVNSGHYVCFKWLNDRWFLADDSRISQVQENKVFNSEAYVLFYEKQ